MELCFSSLALEAGKRPFQTSLKSFFFLFLFFFKLLSSQDWLGTILGLDYKSIPLRQSSKRALHAWYWIFFLGV